MLRCLAALALLIASLLASPIQAGGAARVLPPTEVPRETATEVPLPASVPLSASQEALEAQVASDFPDVPAMVAVVRCESHFRQLTASGTPLISPTHDVGVAQINIPTWGKEAAALHLDIYHSASDNLAMARVVYAEQGIGAWTCAK